MRMVVSVRRAGVLAAVLFAFLATACSAGSGDSASGGEHYTTVSHPPSPSPTGAPVHISLLEGDGGVYGVGMPIVAYFDRKITDSSAFLKAATVTVNGQPANGAWYFENSSRSGEALEAHYRPESYWPAHAKIYLNMPVDGLSAGTGLVYDDSLTLSISTGAANVSAVDCSKEQMTVTSDGKTERTMPVSCGEASHPTYTGTKVLIQKGEEDPKTGKMRPDGAVEMTSNEPGDTYDLIVPWSVRVTYSGEYVHSASWNSGNIGHRSTSHGCTNLNVDDAKWFYNFSTVGDVVTYTNTGGSQMPSWDGYGDWNVDWSTWQAGGAVPSN
jgi:lipoprotein-anchoring transpeptidase ErfK/SrfK